MPKKKAENGLKVKTLRDIPPESYLSTGVPELDKVLGGGFPRKRITQVYGQPGVGKSYLLAQTMASLNKAGGKILYIDAEYALNKARLSSLGIKLEQVDYLPDSRLEVVAEYVIDNIMKYDLVIIDTLAKLTPMVVETNEVGKNAIGLVAREIGHFEAKLRPHLYESKAAVIGINQVRANFGMSNVQTQAFGGWAWNHSIDLSLKLFKDTNNSVFKQEAGVKRQSGHWCSAKVEKSRFSTPLLTTKFLITYPIERENESRVKTKDDL